MRIRIMSLLCAAVILVSVLSGCVANPQSAHTSETETVQKAVLETTEPAETDTRQAAGYTVLDKLGALQDSTIALYESVSEPNIRVNSETFSQMGAEVLYFTSSKPSEKSFADKALAGADVTMIASEYAVDEADAAEVADSFYKADLAENKDITKEAWMEAHADYKIIHYDCRVEYDVSNVTAKYDRENYWWWIYYYLPVIIDQYTGEAFSPYEKSNGVAERFTIGDGAVEFSAVNNCDTYSYIDGESTDNLEDYCIWNSIFILIPKDYDGLVFATELYKENRTDEVIKALFDTKKGAASKSDKTKETSTWWQGDFYFENDYLKRFYFVPVT